MSVQSPYAHHHEFTKARDVHPARHLGPPENRLHAAFTDSYGLLRDYMRTPSFVDELATYFDAPEFAMGFIDGHLLGAQRAFHTDILPTLEKIVRGGMAMGRLETFSVKKAEAGAVRIRKPRAKKLWHGPRLYGLRGMSKPPPHHSFPAAATHIDAAKNLSLALVTHVNATQRGRIRTLVTQAITRGIPPDQTGTRIANVVGLFPRWQNAVENLHASMLRNGIPRPIANQRANEYADELLDRRGTMIARTELMRAMNVGRWQSWHDLDDRGIIDGARSIKEWHGSIDDRICPECEYLSDPQGKGKGMLVLGIDTAFDTEHGDVLMPPLHPHCRCTVLLTPAPRGTARTAHDADVNDEDIRAASDPEVVGIDAEMA